MLVYQRVALPWSFSKQWRSGSLILRCHLFVLWPSPGDGGVASFDSQESPAVAGHVRHGFGTNSNGLRNDLYGTFGVDKYAHIDTYWYILIHIDTYCMFYRSSILYLHIPWKYGDFQDDLVFWSSDPIGFPWPQKNLHLGSRQAHMDSKCFSQPTSASSDSTNFKIFQDSKDSKDQTTFRNPWLQFFEASNMSIYVQSLNHPKISSPHDITRPVLPWPHPCHGAHAAVSSAGWLSTSSQGALA